MKKTSIIITNKDYGRYLSRAIRSAQSQRDCEVIVVDDCSVDNSLLILKTMEDMQVDVKIVRHHENKGLPTAINSGILNSNGMYIIRLDADDFFTHDKIHMMANILDDNKTIDFVWANYYVVDENENIVGKSHDDILGANIMFRRSKLEELDIYGEEAILGEDRELFHRYVAKFPNGYHLPIVTYKFYVHRGSLTDGGVKREIYCMKKEDFENGK